MNFKLLFKSGSSSQFKGLATLLCIGLLASISIAQTTEEDAKTETRLATQTQKPEAQAIDKDAKPKLAEPENVALTTKDGVQLKCTYYEGTKTKSTVPVILVHDFDSKRTHLDFLAKYLQKELGCAVIVPDLRGHGESLKVEGATKDLDRSRFKTEQLSAMQADIERCKKFLMKKNNAGHANIEMLTVAAIGGAGINAAAWCIDDWSWPAVGSVKQGQDVKCLILLAPVKKYKSLSLSQALKHSLLTGKGRNPIAMQIIWSRKAAGDSTAIAESIKKSRKKLSSPLFKASPIDGDLKAATKDKPESEGMTKALKSISDFVRSTIVEKKDELRWRDRSKK